MKKKVKVSTLLLFFIVFNFLTFLNITKVRSTIAEPRPLSLKFDTPKGFNEKSKTFNKPRSIFTNLTPGYDEMAYCLEHSASTPKEEDAYVSPGISKYVGTELEKIIGNIFHYGYPNVSVETLINDYEGHIEYGEIDIRDITNRAYWMAQEMFISTLGPDGGPFPFTVETLKKLDPEDFPKSEGRTNFLWEPDTTILYGILENAISDFEKGIYWIPTPPTTKAALVKDEGFSKVQNNASTIKIGPYTVNIDSNPRLTESTFNITLDDPSAYAVNSAGERITSIASNTKFYIIANNPDVDTNINVKISGITDYYYHYEVAICGSCAVVNGKSKQEMLVVLKEPINDEDKDDIVLNPAIGPSIDKKVNDQTEVKLENRDETFEYKISVVMPEDTLGYSSLTIKDELEDVLEIVTSGVDVNIDNNSILSDGTLNIDGNIVTFKFNDDFVYKDIAGKTIVMNISAKIRSGITDAQLIAKYGEKKAPNKATLIFNGKSSDSNTVKVEPPCKAKLGDYVWFDANNNGIQDPGETPIGNVKVTLYGESGNVLKTTETDSTGHYIFEDLCDGKYYIGFDTPNRYKPTEKESGEDRGKDSNINSDGRTNLISLENGQTDLTIDAGYVEATGPSIGKKVNGKDEVTLQNRDETFEYTLNVSIPEDTRGYTSLEIKDELEDVLEITTSGVDVKVDNESILSSGTLNVDGNIVTFKFEDNFVYSTISGKTVVMTISSKIKSGITDAQLIAKYDEKKVPNKATLVFNDKSSISNIVKVEPPCAAKLGAYVWFDANNNGIQDSDETPIENIKVTLYGENGNVLKTTETDSVGHYVFENLCDGKYYIGFNTPNGYKPTGKELGNDEEKDSNINPDGRTGLINLENGQTDLTIDAGYVEATEPTIDKKVNGINELKIQNRNEVFKYTINVPIPQDTRGYTSLEIKDELADELEILESSVDIKVDSNSVKSSGTLLTNNNSVTFKFNDDFDYSTLSGKTVVMTIEAKIKSNVTDAQLIAKYDEKKVPNKASLVFNDKTSISNTVKVEPPCVAKIGDYVWFDENENGLQDPGELPIGNVKVTLYDEDETYLKETTTGSNGYYSFEGLCDGNYYLKFETPNRYKPTAKESGVSKEIDSNINPDGKTSLISLENGQTDLSIDAGYIEATGPTIEKKVNGKDEVTLENRDDTFEYTINIAIPQDTRGYTSLKITDELEPVLEILESSIDVSVDSNSLKSNGTLSINDNSVTFEFNNEFDYGTLSGKTVIMSISAKIKSDVTDAELIEKHQEKKVPNKASLIFNDKPSISNIVKVEPPCVAKIGDFIWEDGNKNGIQDPGELGIQGIKVTLYDENGNKIKDTLTDSNGQYFFEGLCDGKYKLEVERPDGYKPTEKGVGEDRGKDSNISPDGKTDNVTIENGNSDLSVDAGYVEIDEPGISKKVNGTNEVKLQNRNETFEYTVNVDMPRDTTGSKTLEIKDQLEPVLEIQEADVKVDGNSIKSSGTLLINDNLVTFKLNEEFDYSTIAGKTVIMNISAKIKSDVTDASLMEKYGEKKAPNKATLTFNDKSSTSNTVKVEPSCEAKIGDFIWEDKNKNGIQDPGEPGIQGIKVTLYDENGNKVKDTLTDSNGQYFFEGLCDGKYKLEFERPDGYKPTEKGVGTDREKDSNISPDGKTDNVTIVNGESDLSVDAGYVEIDEPSISKKVNGTNEVKLQSRNETFEYTVNVDIPRDTTGSKTLEIKDQLEDVLEVQNSQVDVKVGGASIKSNGTLNISGNLVTFKFNDNFDYSTIAGKTVVMSISAKIKSDVTDASLIEKYGEKKAPNKATLIFNDESSTSNTVKVEPPCVAKIGDFIWEDKNKNGVQDPGEPGIQGIKVTLYDENGNKIKDTLTDSNGQYFFEGLCDGRYKLEFERPDGYKPTEKGSGTDKEKDSNISPDGKTDTIIIVNGESDLSVDVGYVEIDEPSIDKKVNGTNEVKLQNRNETFEYTVNVDIPRDTTGSKTLEIKDQLEDVLEIQEADVKVDGNSIKSSGTLLISGNLVTFKFNEDFDYSTIAGKTIVMSISAKIKSNITDAKLIEKYGEKKAPNKATLIFNDESSISNTVKVEPPCVAKIGDFVWEDKNKNGIQDPGEPGIQGIKVTLYDENGNKIKDTLTDSNGKYTFEGLCDGKYKLEVQRPDGFKPTEKGSGEDREKDSNISPEGKTDTVVIDNGESDLSVDIGYVEIDEPSIDKKVNGTNEVKLQNRNETFSYSINVDIPKDTTGFKTLEIKDQLEDVLEVINSQVDVKVGGISIKTSGTLTINNNLVKFKFNDGFDYKTISGKTVIMTISAKIKSNVTDAKLIEKYGEKKAPNKASLIFNDKSSISNTVKVEPPCEAKIGDFVWEDKNKNGIQDPGEPGIQGIKVTLYDENGNKIKDTLTDSNGKYSFGGLCDGKYKLEVERPDGYKPTGKESGIDKEKDSNISPDGKTDTLTIVNGESDLSVDVGYVEIDEPSIDKKVNGTNEVKLQNRNETFSYSINVDIPKDTTGFKILEIKDQLEDVLEIQNSQVDVKVSGNSIKSSGTLLINNNLVTFKFNEGFDYKTIAGKKVVMSILAKIKSNVTDAKLIEKYGEKKAPNKATLIFNDESSVSNTVKVEPPCVAKIGDFVWEDKNKNGIQDSGEPGIQGIKVTLYDENGNKIKDTLTDSNGKYSFDGLCDGKYKLEVQRPDGYKPTEKGSGQDREKDSNISPDGKTDTVVIDNGESDLSVDVGYVEIDEPSIDKKVNGTNEVKLQNRNETFEYTVNVDIPKDTTGSKTLEIKDQLEPVLEVQEADVKVDGNSIKSSGTLLINNNLVTFKFNNNFNYGTIAGKTVIMSISAKVKSDITDAKLIEKYGEKKVPNKATLIFNDESSVSNEVKIEPPCEAKIGDFVWDDKNKNGIQDSEEPGIQGVEVTLYNENGNVIKTVLTDSNGKYSFEGLCDGKYKLGFKTPDKYEEAVKEAGEDREKDSNISPNGESDTIVIENGESDFSVDAGYTEKIQIIKKVNGKDEMVLENRNDPFVFTITVPVSKDTRGFTSIEIKDQLEPVLEIFNSEVDVKVDDVSVKSSGTLTIADNLVSFKFNEGFDYSTLAGKNIVMSIKAKIKSDITDEDLIEKYGETKIPNTAIALFENNPNNSNEVIVIPPKDPSINKKVEGKEELVLEKRDETFVYTINVDVPKDTKGYRLLEIRDKLEDALEIVESDVDVKVDNVSVKKNGTLSINNNLVKFKFNEGFDFNTIAGKTITMSIPAKVKSDATDAKLIEKYGEKKIPNKAVLVFNNEETNSNEVKIEPPCNSTIGDFVWEDKNKNGIQDPGEPGIQGVEVTLYDKNGNKIKETLTDSNGKYLFDDLCDDRYSLEFKRPDGFKPTDKEAGTDREKDSNISSNGKTETIIIENGKPDLSVDVGYVEIDEPTLEKKVNDKNEVKLENRNETFIYTVRVSIPKDTTGAKSLEIKDQLENVLEIVESDVDVKVDNVSTKKNGTLLIKNNLVTFKFDDGFDYSTIAGKTVIMSIPAKVKSDITDAKLIDKYGEKKVPNKATLVFNDKSSISNEVKVEPPCVGVLGDFVWDDKNKNGVQDQGEPGIQGVEVTLYDKNGNNVKTVTTDSKGQYKFEDLCDGDYSLGFKIPGGYKSTDKESGRDREKDSNVDLSGKTSLITLTDGKTDLSIDAGFVEEEATITKKVNGKDEISLENRNETFVYTITTPVAKDTTGYMSLEIRDELEDELEVINSDVDVKVGNTSVKSSGTLSISGNLVTFKFNPGFDYSKISGKDIVMSIPAKVKSDITDVKLIDKYGEKKVPNKATLVFNDKSSISNEVKVEPPCVGVLGDFVWDDKNKNGIQDQGEPGIQGVEVTLYDKNGNNVKTVTTDSKGQYKFEDLCDGDYSLGFKIPGGYKSTDKESGKDREKDSNVDLSGKTSLITLTDGKTDLSIDAGFIEEEATITKKVNGKDEIALENRNETFVYTITTPVAKDTTGYMSLEIRDELEDELEVVNSDVDVKVNNTSVKSSGTLKISGNLVTFKFNSGFDYSSISGKDIVMSIPARVKSDATDAKLIEKYGEKKVPNKATLVFNNKTVNSNEVKIEPPCKAELGDFVWNDKNKNGIQDPGELGLPGVEVTLYGKSGNKIKTATTDSNGQYKFEDLCDGDYHLEFKIPDEYKPTEKEVGTNKEKDSNIDSGGKTDSLTIANGRSDSGIDAGFIKKEDPKDPIINKRVNGTSEVTLGNRDDSFLYTINVVIPQETEGYSSLEIKDQLEDSLEIVNSEVDVKVDNTSIKSDGALSINGNSVTFKFNNGFDYSKISGKTVVMSIKARIKSGVTDDDLTRKYGEKKVPNKASTVFNNKTINSNEVKVQPLEKKPSLPQTGEILLENNIFEILFKFKN